LFAKKSDLLKFVIWQVVVLYLKTSVVQWGTKNVITAAAAAKISSANEVDSVSESMAHPID
jgi:hypothetical protein